MLYVCVNLYAHKNKHLHQKISISQKKVTNSSSLFFFSNHSLILSTALTCRMRRPFKSRIASKLVVFLPVVVAPVHWFPTVKVRLVHANGTPPRTKQETWDLVANPPPKKKNMTETRRRLGRIAQKRRAGTKSRSMRYYRFRFCEYLGAAIICSKCCKLQPFVFEVSVSYFF